MSQDYFMYPIYIHTIGDCEDLIVVIEQWYCCFFSFLMFHNIHLNSQSNLILAETIVNLVLDLTF